MRRDWRQCAFVLLEGLLRLMAEEGAAAVDAAQLQALCRPGLQASLRGVLEPVLGRDAGYRRALQMLDGQEGWELFDAMADAGRLGTDPYVICPTLMGSPFLA